MLSVTRELGKNNKKKGFTKDNGTIVQTCVEKSNYGPGSRIVCFGYIGHVPIITSKHMICYSSGRV